MAVPKMASSGYALVKFSLCCFPKDVASSGWGLYTYIFNTFSI